MKRSTKHKVILTHSFSPKKEGAVLKLLGETQEAGPKAIYFQTEKELPTLFVEISAIADNSPFILIPLKKNRIFVHGEMQAYTDLEKNHRG